MAAAAGRGTALVTGGARRIGRALVLAVAQAGYDVAVHHRSAEAEAEQVAGLVREAGRRAVVLRADLSREVETASLVERAGEALGPLSLLVNNASLFLDDRVGALARDTWDAQIETNLRAPLVLSEAFAAQAPRDPGADPLIVNLLDQRVLRPNPRFFTYTLTKAALWTATRTLAQALAPHVRVNGIGPGPTLASVHQDEAAFLAEAAGTPLERAVRPEDLCAAALYLIDARAVTGQMIAVDSGQHLGWRTPDVVGE